MNELGYSIFVLRERRMQVTVNITKPNGLSVKVSVCKLGKLAALLSEGVVNQPQFIPFEL